MGCGSMLEEVTPDPKSNIEGICYECPNCGRIIIKTEENHFVISSIHSYDNFPYKTVNNDSTDEEIIDDIIKRATRRNDLTVNPLEVVSPTDVAPDSEMRKVIIQ